jgi:hypothetical protein
MTIVAAGDSMIWGSELQDSPHGGLNGYSKKTFAALLADEEPYVCVAYPGIGNREIVTRLLDVLNSLDYVGVIVCWTWSSRDNELNADDHIISLQEYLELRGFPYLFTCVDNCILTDNPKINWDHWYLFPPGNKIYETISPRGFYQWAVENKYNVGPDGHPLEQAHKDAAELLKEKYNEMVKKFVQ